MAGNLFIWLYDYYLTHATLVGYSGQDQQNVKERDVASGEHLQLGWGYFGLFEYHSC